jgi:Methylene-tetrahydrofolate reductase C terminal
MISVRYWSVRNARFLEWFYQRFESALISLHPVFKFIGYDRLERPAATLEKWVKGFMFDCQMCGQCVLSSTGMSCPMNCPKTLRNGPCGGVRPDGNCEVKPDMRCVWVDAWEGSGRMRNGESIRVIQIAVDHRLQGRSSWLRVVKQHFGVEE